MHSYTVRMKIGLFLITFLFFFVQMGCKNNQKENNASAEYTPDSSAEPGSVQPGSSSTISRGCNSFPLNPPKASAFKVIPRNLLIGSAGTPDIDYVINQRLLPALDNAGYEYSFYCMKDSGVAVVTRIEKMNEDGSSDLKNRYVEGTESDKLWDYLKSLIKASPGFYRSIVFIISPNPIRQSTKGLSREASDSLFQNGTDRPYYEILSYPFSKRYECTALIYQYKKMNEVDDAVEISNAALPVIEQLSKAKIWSGLSKK